MNSTVQQIRWLIWLYVALLFLEGALRKWIVPQLATPLLIVRDPVVLLIYFLALKERLFPFSAPVQTLMGLGIITLITGMFGEDSNWIVAAYGFRVNYLHIPLVFLFPYIVDRAMVIKIGKVFLWIALPMAGLMVFQFLSPPSHFINTGAGHDVVQIRATVGNIRPPGVFSFVTGVAEYYALVTAFLCYGVLYSGAYRFNLLIWGALGLIAGCVVSISRLTLTGVILVTAFACALSLWRSRQTLRMMGYFVLGALFIALLLQFEFIQLGVSTFSDRIKSAGGSEGGWAGYLQRIFGVFVEPLDSLGLLPFFGEGLGMGTSAASGLITGARGYLLSEGEWARCIMENGFVLGVAFLAWRVWFAIYLGYHSLRSLMSNDGLPMLLFAAAMPLLLVGQWGRPTTLGFSVLAMALCYTACFTAVGDRRRR